MPMMASFFSIITGNKERNFQKHFFLFFSQNLFVPLHRQKLFMPRQPSEGVANRELGNMVLKG